MSLEEKITNDLKTAMKTGETLRRETLSLLRSQIYNKAIQMGKKEEGLTDTEVVEIVSTEIKRRREAAEGFKKGNRDDLAQKEITEQEILKEYLPSQMSEVEVRAEIEKILDEAGTRSKKDFGVLMGKAMAGLKGRADGAMVRSALEKLLE